MNSIFRILVTSVLLLGVFAGCTGQTEPPPVIALFAPFEGRYQEFGYDALYAARLALADQDSVIDLVAYDDGSLFLLRLPSRPDAVEATSRDPSPIALRVACLSCEICIKRNRSQCGSS